MIDSPKSTSGPPRNQTQTVSRLSKLRTMGHLGIGYLLARYFTSGRPLREFRPVVEFLEACHDFIRGHRTLYNDGRILQRDISDNTIIIIDADLDGDLGGMHIDLDLAKEQ
ncbi:hypothetical protein P152DRAFT_338809 [Eremomyces bilateralis CBS 781.70]|uniref:Fungal-type protein kinase domain-containing protein n=1 Tax=Eremomyces bilateralis CBS 781.70 TaxID=1392243 RepID=A0A6G1G3P5_9PEZI|nr:uncharacterized protein P152DRAFT_338809 [Eremomyces bilateralis CBS 781.70]KAF1812439.1 hypothetical protein P152DRAFT_338809 [Eremomyces bilateralis CBS 781.70]